MPANDIRSRADIESCLDVQTITTDTVTTGEIIDTQGYEALDFCFNAEVNQGSLSVAFYEGDESDMSDEAEVDSAFLVGTATVADGSTGTQTMHVGYVGHKRYTRAKVTSADSATATIAGIAYKGRAKHCPTV